MSKEITLVDILREALYGDECKKRIAKRDAEQDSYGALLERLQSVEARLAQLEAAGRTPQPEILEKRYAGAYVELVPKC